ncbi:hypothetical protein AX16_001981 [Volvariella volvacea WC 439]|nr:hypothetical protein AX16_001981 [Volvariella volvacea WC 439]
MLTLSSLPLVLFGIAPFGLVGATPAPLVKRDPIQLILTNDDGWAVAQIRSEYTALKEAGYEVILSAPTQNKSGTGSTSAPATILNTTCEFNTCAVGSRPEGSDPNDPFLNYVNAFPVDSVRFGIQTLAPKLFGGPPQFVVAGNNIGNNLGSVVLISGTMGAATEAALEGIPSVAFSGASGSQVSFTTLNNTAAASTVAANIYTGLVVKFTNTILASPGPILPPGITVNVNFPAISSTCASVEDFNWIFTRIFVDSSAVDVETCGTNRLTDETTAIKQGKCTVTVSAMDAVTKGDVSASIQKSVLDKVSSILTCL